MTDEQTQYVALRERVKELTCLYSLAQLAQRPDVTLEQILQGTAELLPHAWQYPEITAARITLDGQTYYSKNFTEDGQTQSAPIVINGRQRGSIDVAYTERRPELDEGPFLKEERSLIDAIARHLALVVERRQADEDRFRLQEQLRHADRLATIGQLSAGVAHELNEPLGNILGFAQLAQRQAAVPEQVAQDLEKIVATCLHARQIIANLMLFSRQTPPQKSRVDLNAVVEEGLCLLEPQCAKNGISVIRDLAWDLPKITADASQLRQVLVNLVVNAIHAMPAGGTLEVGTRSSGDRVVLTVRDDGIGMNEQVLKEIFIPFFTTKDINEGTGLGLPVVHGIVTSHGGAIHVESSAGRGARFEIELPLAPGGERLKDHVNGFAK
jgi:signal transduction histidine kinase